MDCLFGCCCYVSSQILLTCNLHGKKNLPPFAEIYLAVTFIAVFASVFTLHGLTFACYAAGHVEIKGVLLLTLVVQTWGTDEVAAWLELLSLGEYKEIFISHDIRGSELLHLERRDLKVFSLCYYSARENFSWIENELKSFPCPHTSYVLVAWLLLGKDAHTLPFPVPN